MDHTKLPGFSGRSWSFALMLVALLVALVLVTTAVTSAVNISQVADQLKSYYVYLPIVFHR